MWEEGLPALGTLAFVVQEAANGRERSGAQVVLDALGIGLGVFSGNPQSQQEFNQQVVTLPGFFGEALSSGGEKHRAVWGGGDQPFPFQSGDGLGYGHVGDAEPPGKVHGAGLSGLGDQVVDEFDVVLGGLLSVVGAGAAEGIGSPLVFSGGGGGCVLDCSWGHNRTPKVGRADPETTSGAPATAAVVNCKPEGEIFKRVRLDAPTREL